MQTAGQVDPQAELRSWLTSPFAHDAMRQQMEQAQEISDYFQPQNPLRQLQEQMYKPQLPVLQPEFRPWLSGPQKIGSVFEPGGMR